MRSKQIPALDGLRGLAIAAVLVSHFSRTDVKQVLAFGWFGVRLFFVLSGYLITGILIEARNLADTGQVNEAVLVRNFYARRFLRIFPIYYLTLAAVAIGLRTIRPELWWHVTYLCNWSYFFGVVPLIGHFWSLAVEEQFYLVWPSLFLWLPRRWLPLLLVVLLIVPIGMRHILLSAFPADAYLVTRITPCCLDTFAGGGLLALAHPRTRERYAPLLISLGVIPLTIAMWRGPYELAWSDSAAALVCTGLVGMASIRLRALGSRPLAWLGRISYGIYVYHGFAPLLVSAVTRRIGWAPRYPIQCALWTGCTLLGAALSWKFVEAPINSLKRLFPMQGPPIAARIDAIV